jgi:hypothetical protein
MIMLKKLSYLIAISFIINACTQLQPNTEDHGSEHAITGKYCTNSCDLDGKNCTTICTNKKPSCKLPAKELPSLKGSSQDLHHNENLARCINFCMTTMHTCTTTSLKKQQASEALTAIKSSTIPTKNNKSGISYPVTSFQFGAESYDKACKSQYTKCAEDCIKESKN